MNNTEILEPIYDLTRWFGAIPEILRMIAQTDLMQIAGAALMFGFAWLLVYKLTSFNGE